MFVREGVCVRERVRDSVCDGLCVCENVCV